MASPRPVPRCIESPRGPAFTCSNSSKMRVLIARRDADAGIDDLQRDPRAPRDRASDSTQRRVVRRSSRRCTPALAGGRPTSRARTAMPPAGVYFTALPMRLTRICRRCVGSVRTRGSDAPTAIEKLSPVR